MGERINELDQTLTTQQRSSAVTGNLRYTKKLKKKGRALWINGYLTQQLNNEMRKNEALTTIYNNIVTTTTDTLAQDQQQTEDHQIYLLEMGYAEPLGAKTSLEV